MQAYVSPVGEEEICVVLVSRDPQLHLDAAWREFPELGERLLGNEPLSKERGAVTAMRSLKNVFRKNVVLIGDASGGVDAITGEGLRLSFVQAKFWPTLWRKKICATIKRSIVVWRDDPRRWGG